LCVLAGLDQAGLTQHPEVPGHPGSGDGDHRGQFVHRRRVITEGLEHRAAMLVGDRVKDSIHE
jgi:hypothetical protein